MPFLVARQEMAKETSQAVPLGCPFLSTSLCYSQGSVAALFNLYFIFVLIPPLGIYIILCFAYPIRIVINRIFDYSIGLIKINGLNLISRDILLPEPHRYTLFPPEPCGEHSEGAVGSMGEALGAFLSRFLDEYQEIAYPPTHNFILM